MAHRALTWCLTWWAAALAAPLWAQSSPAPAAASRRTLCEAKGWVQYTVVLGRLCARGARPGASQSCSAEDSAQGTRESYVASDRVGNHDRPSSRYERTTPHEQVLVEFREGHEVLATRTPRGDATCPTIHFRQPAAGPLWLEVRDGETTRVATGASLWHLLLAEPQLCRKHLVPLLETQRGDWNLASQAEAVARGLLWTAEFDSSAARDEARRCIAQLNDADYAARRAAQRRLKSLGTLAYPELCAAQRAPLAAEQRRAVRDLLADLARADRDTPESTAAWLAADRGVWLALLENGCGEQRQTAADQLARDLGTRFQYDPAASEETRRRQVESLRRELARSGE